MITAPDGSALYYRQLAAFVRARKFCDERGVIDYARLDQQRLRRAENVLRHAQHEKTAKALRTGIEMAIAAIELDDEELIKIVAADDAARAEEWEAKAAEIEARETQGEVGA